MQRPAYITNPLPQVLTNQPTYLHLYTYHILYLQTSPKAFVQLFTSTFCSYLLSIAAPYHYTTITNHHTTTSITAITTLILYFARHKSLATGIWHLAPFVVQPVQPCVVVGFGATRPTQPSATLAGLLKRAQSAYRALISCYKFRAHATGTQTFLSSKQLRESSCLLVTATATSQDLLSSRRRRRLSTSSS